MNKQLLEFTGSLLLDSKYIVSPYGISKKLPKGEITPLNYEVIHNNSISNITINYTTVKNLTIVNGMGVTLGDSIIGISALHNIKKINPGIKIRVIRPENCPSYVNELYHLAKSVIDEIYYMPYDISHLKDSDVIIDMGNQVYWEDFNRLEMHDFFLKSLGLNYNDFSPEEKSNRWLQECIVEELDLGEYVLYCPNASTKIRSIPAKFHHKTISQLTKEYGKNVFGFIDINHENYTNIAATSKNTAAFISIIKNSKYIYTCDSSALHIAAGFNVPSTCIFTTVKPELRSIYYKDCHSIYIGNNLTEGIHNSEDEFLIKLIEKEFEVYHA
ncbi:TPA: glycosyltransferase family 9 protein [Klebsiella pneumoniae]|jgi:ADP-heptose:LPS heptosyltransferase|nr:MULTISPECIES: hypothetical protein [Enterobacteriaceae]EAB8199747.1 hypothetical protein [Salmonella enterica subsp. enterica serovar Infantis]EAO2851314.1 hypothetical protein [Salmonella enterica]EEK7814035.1 glycosyltransferase family 9 protein [Salmonella enterica subsp. enterica serovar Montevideo]APV28423.1 hypothetical protein A6P56_29595 [Klebsiella pneumoniae]AXZ56666.1 hypothetical protein AM488_29950 [Klebsiella pneumoniae]